MLDDFTAGYNRIIPRICLCRRTKNRTASSPRKAETQSVRILKLCSDVVPELEDTLSSENLGVDRLGSIPVFISAVAVRYKYRMPAGAEITVFSVYSKITVSIKCFNDFPGRCCHRRAPFCLLYRLK